LTTFQGYDSLAYCQIIHAFLIIHNLFFSALKRRSVNALEQRRILARLGLVGGQIPSAKFWSAKFGLQNFHLQKSLCDGTWWDFFRIFSMREQ
jgi:hypothetical protein